MMTVTLLRFKEDVYGTMGELQAPRCYILERPATGPHCRIPAGTFKLGLKKIGTSKFDPIAESFMPEHHGMIEVVGVPGRSEILIHWGNSAVDSEGCLLTGNSFSQSNIGSHGAALTFWLNESRKAYARVYPTIADAILTAGAQITITDPTQEPLVA